MRFLLGHVVKTWRPTFFMFSARRSYSSSTSCSRGVRSSFGTVGRADIDSDDSMMDIDRDQSKPNVSCVGSSVPIEGCRFRWHLRGLTRSGYCRRVARFDPSVHHVTTK